MYSDNSTFNIVNLEVCVKNLLYQGFRGLIFNEMNSVLYILNQSIDFV